jgi:putative spermidine/putrescine transport system ATP-binding protein
VAYLGSVTHYVVDLETGGTLTVLRQNLHGSADQALSHQGQPVDLGWADEHIITLASGPTSAAAPHSVKETP